MKASFALLCAFAALNARAVDVELLRFAGAKEAQAREFAKAQTNSVPSYLWTFFDAVRVDDWETATNLHERLRKVSGRFSNSGRQPGSAALQSPLWQPISETFGAYEQFHNWDRKWLRRFADEIIGSIPKGSVYFGGTDPGRFVISAFSESHREGVPFFTLTQNQLADGTYLEYLRKMYGGKLYIPTADDTQKAFSQYTLDAAERFKAGKLKPGENIRFTEEGRAQVSGQVAVMEINGLLVKTILEKNPSREFYVEESFPLDWMYPQLSPHGLILQLHARPLTELRPDMIQQDQDYWKRLAGELVGNWITDTTSVRQICDFNEKIYQLKDLAGFKGDAGFAGNADAQKTFSKLRSAIAGLYVWRADHAHDDDERNRLRQSAELAYKQALVLCPASTEAVFRYGQFLQERRRHDEAILIAQTCLRVDPSNVYIEDWLKTLRQME